MGKMGQERSVCEGVGGVVRIQFMQRDGGRVWARASRRKRDRGTPALYADKALVTRDSWRGAMGIKATASADPPRGGA